MTPDPRPAEAALLAGLGQPLRLRILELMLRDPERDDWSPTKLADELEGRLANVSYHVRVLEGAGALERTREVPHRGALEHYYRPTIAAARVVNVVCPGSVT